MHIASGLSRACKREPLLSDVRGPRRIRQAALHVAAGLEEGRDRRTLRIVRETPRSRARAKRRRALHHQPAAHRRSSDLALQPRLALPPAAAAAPPRGSVAALTLAAALTVRLLPDRVAARGGPLFARIHMPERSGLSLPSSVRGVGASYLMPPFSSRGTFVSGTFPHCAATVTEPANTRQHTSSFTS